MVDTAQYKERLQEMLTELTEELQAIGVKNPDIAEDWTAIPEGVETGEADPNVGADRVEEWEERRATLSALETRYNNIRRALGKIANGTFGICELGGEEIEADRLDANPAARTCKAHLNNEADLPLN